jgi:hypothetical protein
MTVSATIARGTIAWSGAFGERSRRGRNHDRASLFVFLSGVVQLDGGRDRFLGGESVVEPERDIDITPTFASGDGGADDGAPKPEHCTYGPQAAMPGLPSENGRDDCHRESDREAREDTSREKPPADAARPLSEQRVKAVGTGHGFFILRPSWSDRPLKARQGRGCGTGDARWIFQTALMNVRCGRKQRVDFAVSGDGLVSDPRPFDPLRKGDVCC